MDWFYLYLLGFGIVIAAVALGLNLIGVPPTWILGIVAALVVVAGVTAIRPGGGGRRGGAR